MVHHWLASCQNLRRQERSSNINFSNPTWSCWVATVGHIISLSYVNDTNCALSLPRAFHLMPCLRKMELKLQSCWIYLNLHYHCFSLFESWYPTHVLLDPWIKAWSIFLFSTSFTTDWQAAKIIRRHKRYSSINFSNLSPFAIFISFRSRSLLSLLKPEWRQSKQRAQNSAIWTSVLWPLPYAMVSFCGRCWIKNANGACASIQVWYRLVRLVGWCSSYTGRWSNSQKGLL